MYEVPRDFTEEGGCRTFRARGGSRHTEPLRPRSLRAAAPARAAVLSPHPTASPHSAGPRSVLIIMALGMVASQAHHQGRDRRGELFRDAEAAFDGIHRHITWYDQPAHRTLPVRPLLLPQLSVASPLRCAHATAARHRMSTSLSTSRPRRSRPAPSTWRRRRLSASWRGAAAPPTRMARSVDTSSHTVVDAIDTVLANGCASGRGGGGGRLRLWARSQHTPRGGRAAGEQRRRHPVRCVALSRGPLDAYCTV